MFKSFPNDENDENEKATCSDSIVIGFHSVERGVRVQSVSYLLQLFIFQKNYRSVSVVQNQTRFERIKK